jgi:phage major head subunit gpT-like protein
MASPTPSNWNLFVSSVNTMIGEVFSETDASIGSVWREIATEVPSNSSQVAHAWTGMLQKARQWVGPRVVMQASPETYIVINRRYEHTLGIDKDDLMDDHLGVYYRQLPDQVRQIRRHPDYWIRDLIEGAGTFASGQPGNPQNGFDGLTNWNTAHPIDIYLPGSATYCNDFGTGGQSIAGGVPNGSGSNITVGGAFGVVAYSTLYNYMTRILGQDNEPLGIIPDTFMSGVQLKTEAELVIKAQSFAPPTWATLTSQVGAADNPFKRFAVQNVIINPFLTKAAGWYLLDTKRAIKPFQWQNRVEAVYTQRVNEADPVVFDTHRLLFGVWGRGAPAWGYPFLAARSGV